jgi:hypothetical protein
VTRPLAGGILAGMRARLLVASLSCCLFLVATTATAAPSPATIDDVQASPEAEARYEELRALLSSSAAAKIVTASVEIAPKLVDPSPKVATKVATTWVKTEWGKIAKLGEADIMALAFIVLMEAAKSAREDLKAIMDGVKAINNAKDQLRERVDVIGMELMRRGLQPPKAKRKAKLKPIPPSPSAILELDVWPPPEVPALPVLSDLTDAALLSLASDFAARVAEATDIAEKQQLKLQMAMDRLTRSIALVSQLVKKAATADTAVISKLG